tara:strand:- start:600 stop:755 length:156 start_codon:yes stop_codon:yes gene_type:complete
MTLDTQMTLALLQELLLAIRANDAEGLEAKKSNKRYLNANGRQYDNEYIFG